MGIINEPTVRVPLKYYRRVIFGNVILILVVLFFCGQFLSSPSPEPIHEAKLDSRTEIYFPFDLTLPGSADGEFEPIIRSPSE